MTTTVTTHSTSVQFSKNGAVTTLTSEVPGDTVSKAQQAPLSLPSSLISVSGLLNSRNLVQDEKLVVATLATLDSGNVSNLIKQDLKLSIQSRRKAEGKAEIQVEFKKPVKDELTSEELIKRARRRELNRLAARRSREKGQKRKDMLVEEIRKLQSENSELISMLGDLTEERNTIVETLRQHMKQCSDYHATQSAAVGMSQRVLDLLGFPSFSSSQSDLPGVSNLYISTGELSSTPPQSHSPSVSIKTEKLPYHSCPSSSLVVGLSGKVIKMEESALSLSSKRMSYEDTSSSMLSSSPYSCGSPLTGYSTPLASPQMASFESPTLPPSRLPLRPRRSSTQGLESSPCTAMDQGERHDPEEDQVVHYKHKLMKYRNQSTEFSKPSYLGARGSRVSLERSFSFPCTTRESRSGSKGGSASESYMEDPSFSDNSVGFQETSTTTSTVSVDTASEEESHDSPLDLALHRTHNSVTADSHVSHMDTWPPAGSRSLSGGIAARGLERRWSVDDHHSLSQPLNLSSKEVAEGDEFGVLFHSSTGSSSGYSKSPSLQASSAYHRSMPDSYS